MRRHLAELRLPDIARLSESSILIQPVGAIEQHGPHLPVSVDATINQGLVEATLTQDLGGLRAAHGGD